MHPAMVTANSAGVGQHSAVQSCSSLGTDRAFVGDGIVSLHEWFALQNDDARQELHALGFVDGHEGQQSLSVKFYLQLDTQKGNEMGNKR